MVGKKSKITDFTKLINGMKSLNMFEKNSILDILQAFELAPTLVSLLLNLTGLLRIALLWL